MAGEGVQNVIARRVTDDLIIFSGETSPSRYTKFLLEQKIAEIHSFSFYNVYVMFNDLGFLYLSLDADVVVSNSSWYLRV
ncbi:hypothetical protein Tco_0213182 [Tanacetum coccineum]